jgi:AhpD family alkylhydroperoxidase
MQISYSPRPGASFDKRFYRPSGFIKDLGGILRSLPSIYKTFRSGRLSRSFIEKIMLAVTAVNGCRYCAYGHARLALRSGVSGQEIEEILSRELGSFPPEQGIALAFAQHYAESSRRPDPQTEARLAEYYGPQVSQDIHNLIRLITVGNLSGNAADAFLSRLAGRPARESRFSSELVMFLLTSPVILPLLLLLKARGYQEK